jgi:hypothetical protein
MNDETTTADSIWDFPQGIGEAPPNDGVDWTPWGKED